MKPIKSAVHRIPFIKRRPVSSQINTQIMNQLDDPVAQGIVRIEGCTLCNPGIGCNGKNYSCVTASFEENPTDFRLIRIPNGERSGNYWDELVKSAEFVKSQGCNLRVITDSSIPNWVVYAFGYSPYNVIQYNINLLDGTSIAEDVKRSLITSANCGVYTSLMLYPILPGVTKSYNIIDLVSSVGYACRNLCFKFLELPADYASYHGFFNVKGNMVFSGYMEQRGGKIVCNDYFKESFCTILTSYMNPRKVSCSLCNDRICY